MPLKFQLDWFNPYAHESSPKKLQLDRQTDGHTNGLSKTTCFDVSMVVLYIPNPVSFQTRFFARCQHVTSMGPGSNMTLRKLSEENTPFFAFFGKSF